MPPKAYEVKFRPRAEADLRSLYDYIADASGAVIAAEDLDRIQAQCLSLAAFPERGTRRDDIRPGLRIVSFERRVTIVFQALQDEVVVVRIFYGGRDYENLLRREAEE